MDGVVVRMGQGAEDMDMEWARQADPVSRPADHAQATASVLVTDEGDAPKFTAEELGRIFPDGLPMWLVKVMWEPEKLTTGDLRRMVEASRPKPAALEPDAGVVAELVEALRWIEQHAAVSHRNNIQSVAAAALAKIEVR